MEQWVLQSVKPAARDNTGNPDLNQGEYDVSNYTEGSDQGIGGANTEGDPNTL